MPDAIAVAPAGATTSQSRPKKVAKGRHEPDPRPQWIDLGLQHTRRLCDLLYHLVDNHEDAKAGQLVQDLVASAEAHLHNLVGENSFIDATQECALSCQIEVATHLLEGAWYAAQHGPMASPPDIYAAVLPASITYAHAIKEALRAAPDPDPLRALLAQPLPVAGVRTYREPPRPPIRRIEGQPEDLMHNAIMFGDLVQWISGARDTLEALGWAARNYPEFKEHLRRLDIPWGSPDWTVGLASEGVSYLLNEQHVAIKALGAAAIAAKAGAA